MSRSIGTRFADITGKIIDFSIASFLIGSVGCGIGMLVAAALFYPSREMTFSWWVVMGFFTLVALALFYWPEIKSLLKIDS